MRGLYHLVDLVGGLKGLKERGMILTCFTWGDTYYSIMKGQLPHLILPSDFGLPYPTLPAAAHGSATPAGNGFKRLTARGIVHKDLAKITEEVHFLTHLAASNTQNANLGAVNDIFVNRRDYLENKLAVLISGMKDDEDKAAEELFKPIERCICLVILLFMNIALRNMPPGCRPNLVLSKRLQAHLPVTDLNGHWGWNSEVYFWVLFIVSMRELPGGFSMAWIKNLLRDAVEKMDLVNANWQKVEQLLTKFLWSDYHCLEMSLKLWDEIKTGRNVLEVPEG